MEVSPSLELQILVGSSFCLAIPCSLKRMHSLHCEVAGQRNVFHPQNPSLSLSKLEDSFLNQPVADISIMNNFKTETILKLKVIQRKKKK